MQEHRQENSSEDIDMAQESIQVEPPMLLLKSHCKPINASFYVRCLVWCKWHQINVFISHLETSRLFLFHGHLVVVPHILCWRVALRFALQEQSVPLRHCLGLGLAGDEQSTDRPWKQAAAAVWG